MCEMQSRIGETIIGFSAALALLFVGCVGGLAADDRIGVPPEKPKQENIVEQGRVVWLGEALARRYGINSVPEAEKRILALETDDGRLLPLVEDVRGRAFRRDARLRAMKVELLARRFEHTPLLQIIRVVELQNGKRYEIDYWCDICAIAMYELKPCDCCQGPIELRRREVK